jgi:RNA polymerase sigma-70 factor (ECF subfamily)
VAPDDSTQPGDRGRAQDRIPDGTSSTELVRRARDGDRRALDSLFERYRPILRRWAAGRLPRWARDLVDTDDMIQETMMGTLRNIQNFVPRHEGAFGAYLRQALNNRIRDEIRKANVRPQRVEISTSHGDPGVSPLEEAIGREAMQRYEAALAKLNDEERELIFARIEMGLSFKDVATATDKPSADAARMAVGRALLKLATEMGDE